jgi:hypothetical protein
MDEGTRFLILSLDGESYAAPIGRLPEIDPNFVNGLVFDDDQEITILDFERSLNAG